MYMFPLDCQLTHHLARFVSYYDTTMMNEEGSKHYSDELMCFAKAQLLDSPTQLDDLYGLSLLACLSAQFALEFNFADKSS